MMIDHLTLTVRDIEKSRAFYDKALAPLGYELCMSYGGSHGYGANKKPELWLKQGPEPSRPMHIAFVAKKRADVDAFHAAALAAGAKDDGKPGPRPYHATYYGAFVIDPDGHPIEAVCHRE
jgi:catechol 2,3-dioxygenase-like lactoylglutathione lyase family enzyme